MAQSYSVLCDVDVPLRDGIRLRTDIWRPERSGALPAILFRTPYDRSRLISDFFSPLDAVNAGFVAVVQDVRGRFASEGDWRAFDWAQEGRDTYDSVEWAAGQSWCSGAVGMAGPSYLGIVQLAGAVLRPPHLKAIAPAIASAAKHERPEHGGALWLDHLFSWLGLMTLDWARRARAAGRVFNEAETSILVRCVSDMRSIMSERPLSKSALFQFSGFPVEFARVVESAATPDLDVHSIDIPVLACGGWYDYYLRGTLGLFQDAPAHEAHKRHLIVGSWAHGATLPYFQGQVNFGLAASGAGGRLVEYHAAFFRRHLLGERAELPRVAYFLMNSGQWRTAATWPPPSLRKQRLFLRSDGVLSPESPRGDEPIDEYEYDPADPPPAIGGRTLSMAGLVPGPVDQTSLAARADTLVYDGAPESRDVDLIGPVSATLYISSGAVDTDFICKLIDVAADGLALPITDGIVRLAWRQGFDAPAPYEPDTVESIRIDLASVAWRLKAGHWLRVQIQSGNFPHIDANPNTGVPTGEGAQGVRARNRLHHSESSASFLDFTHA